MKNADQRLLEEAYNKINEGIWDRIKAKSAEIGGALKGAKQTVSGAMQHAKAAGQFALGKDAEAAATRAAGQQQIQAGKTIAQNAKIDSILKSKTTAINKLAADIINDLDKLGLNTDTTGGIGGTGKTSKTPEQLAKGMLTYLTNEINARRLPTP